MTTKNTVSTPTFADFRVKKLERGEGWKAGGASLLRPNGEIWHKDGDSGTFYVLKPHHMEAASSVVPTHNHN
ncbi:Uncharacterised protein [Halioglobus japonicus]|nr:Uncharacterised protein [Halioglobus japonicus]